jgi:hypothetical protein
MGSECSKLEAKKRVTTDFISSCMLEKTSLENMYLV